LWILLLAGCASQPAVLVKSTELTAQEKSWIAKAYRQEKNGWIFVHIEGWPWTLLPVK
jgi:hypothetical protein